VGTTRVAAKILALADHAGGDQAAIPELIWTTVPRRNRVRRRQQGTGRAPTPCGRSAHETSTSHSDRNSIAPETSSGPQGAEDDDGRE